MFTFKNKKASAFNGECTVIQFAQAESMPQVENKLAYSFGIEWIRVDESELSESFATQLCIATDSLGQSVRYFGRL